MGLKDSERFLDLLWFRGYNSSSISMSSPIRDSSWALVFLLDSFCSRCLFISTKSLRVTSESCSLFEKSISPFESFSSCSFLVSIAVGES